MFGLRRQLPWHEWSDWSCMKPTKDGGAYQTKRCVHCGKVKVRWL